MSPRPILIADDDPMVVMLLELILQDFGRPVVACADGLAAWEAIPEVRPELVILDSMMPRMGGIEVLRRIRADASLDGVRVFMLTARRHEDDVVSALRQGAEDYVTKPFNPDELKARIDRWARATAA